jgi:predicted dehydrogenase
MSRRDFIQASGKAAAASLAAPAILRGASPTADPVRLGHIGLGTRGGNLVRYTGQIDACRVVAACDVYKPHLEKGVRLSNNPEVRAYKSYHDLLDDPRVEAVVIATPDHWHEQMLLDAVAAGKDVYCEKGWTVSVAAAKRMRAAVKETGAVMQLGHQGRQHASADVARQMILDGAIGEITLVSVGRFFNGPPDRPPWRWYGAYDNYERPDPDEVIRDLDWASWLGTAPYIDFNERHFWHWRCYWPYGTGQAGDLLSHEMDFVHSVLRHGIPDTCVTAGHNAYWHDDREVPDTWTCAYVFEQQDHTVTFEGCMNSNRKQTPEFIGRGGRMIFNDIGQDASMFEIYPDEPAYELARRPQPQPTFFFAPTREHQRPSHMENFLQCVRTREIPWCNEDEAFVDAVTLLMSVESYHQRRQVRWDGVAEEIVACEASGRGSEPAPAVHDRSPHPGHHLAHDPEASESGS